MKLRRFVAYMIDFMLVEFLAAFLVFIPAFGYDFEEHKEAMDMYINFYLSANEDKDEDEFIQVLKDFDRSSLPLTISLTTVTFLYFGVFGYIRNGQTLGKKIMKLRIVPIQGKELNPHLFILREVILLDIGFNLLRILVTLFCRSSDAWLTCYTIVGNLSSMISFAIYGFVLMRMDGRGLHDMIAQTKVISES